MCGALCFTTDSVICHTYANIGQTISTNKVKEYSLVDARAWTVCIEKNRSDQQRSTIMTVLARSLYACRFLEVINRVCLVQTGEFLSMDLWS